MATPTVDAQLLEHVDGLLSPFTTRQYSHLPTPQSPNTLGRYINEQLSSPETPVPHNASSSITPAFSGKHESWKSLFSDKSTRLESIASQYATPQSSPQFQHTALLPLSCQAPPPYPFHATEFSTPKQSISSSLDIATPLRASSPIGSLPSHSPSLSSPFIGRIPLDAGTTHQGLPLPSADPDDVFSAPKLQTTVVKNTLSTPPVSPLRDTHSTPAVLQSGGEMERIRQAAMEDTRNHMQEAEGRRPDYLKRAKRSLSETDPSYFEDPNDRERWPPIGVTDSPQKGRRLKLFQETSDESFEESLMAGGYGLYRTTDWVRQPQPISLRSTIGGSSVVVSLLEKVEEAPATEKELKKQKRLAAFRSLCQSGTSKVCPVELEGKGRVLMEVTSVEPTTTSSPEPIPIKRKATNRRKRPGGSSPEKKARHAGSNEARLEKPNWPDAEFPWRIRTEERDEEEKAVQEERLRWIERYLDRDSDEEDEVVSHIDEQDSPIFYDRDSRTSYQVKMGRGKMIPLSVAPDDPWNLIPKRTFPLDPADAREALLSKKSVRTLSYRQQKRKRRDEDDNEDEALCICRGEGDGRQLVQCDSCQMWYHLECIGLSIAALGREEDPWFCGMCQARNRSPSTEIDDAPSSEPTFVPTEPLPMSRRSSDATFFQPHAPESPNWSSARMPRTPTRSVRNALDFRSSWNGADLPRPMPSTPHHKYNTPEALDTHGSNFYDDSPFDPTSTPSRGIKFHVPFATPRATWRPNPLPQTPSRNRAGTNKYHVPHSASLDDNSLSVGSGLQYSFARVLSSDESPIRRNRSSDAAFGRRRYLSPIRPMP